MRAGDLVRLGLSASPYGSPITVDSSIATLHDISLEDVADKMFVEVFNGGDEDVPFELIINPASTSTADVAAATIAAVCPKESQRFILEGHEVRKRPGAPYTIAIRAANGDVAASPPIESDLRVIGYAVRRKGAPEPA